MTRKYHLALSLIRKVKEKKELTVKLENNQNLAHVLAKASAAAEEDHMITVVSLCLCLVCEFLQITSSLFSHLFMLECLELYLFIYNCMHEMLI